MIYATFSSDGSPTGFYIPEIHGENIPAGAIEISEADYQKYVQEQGLWIRDPGTGTITAKAVTLLEAQVAKLAEIKAAFVNECCTGIVATSLGFPMDARRDGVNNDLDNMIQLAQAMIDEGMTTAEVTDANNVKQACTLAQVQTLVREIRLCGLARYAKKSTLRDQVNAATTVAAVEAITW